MANLREVSEIKEYDKQAKEREQKLQELELQAAEYVQQVEHYQSIEQHLIELRRQHGQLSGERESLRAEYADATFSNDFERIEVVHNKREDIDNSLGEVFQAIEDTEAWLQSNPPPKDAMADVIAAEYMISKPSIYEVVEAIKSLHSEQATDLQSRRVKLSKSLQKHVSDKDVENAKRRVSSEYDKRAEKLEQDKVKAQQWREIQDQLPNRVASKDRHQQEQYAREVLGVEV